jgi:hypothetical protein
VLQAIDKILEKGPSVWNEAYNIGSDEPVSLGSILARMSRSMGLDLEEKDFEVDGDFYLYPTVYAGPMSNQVTRTGHGTRCYT